MLVAPPPPAAVGAYGIATAGMTPSVLGPAGLLILIGTTLTNSACENTSRPGARGKDLACYTMAFCATTATIAAMATPDMPQTFNDREGAHYGAQPHKYKMEEPPPSTRPLPPWEAHGASMSGAQCELDAGVDNNIAGNVHAATAIDQSPHAAGALPVCPVPHAALPPRRGPRRR